MTTFPNILFIGPDGNKTEVLADLLPLLDAGLSWFQLRLKDKSEREVEDIALACLEKCANYNCLFTLNDHPYLAAKINCHGAHVGQNDMPVVKAKKILKPKQHVGATANTIDEALEAFRNKADYIGFGPYRFTSTKKNLAPSLGLDTYRKLLITCKVENMNKPIIAIGGLDFLTTKMLHEIGIRHFAYSQFLRGSDGVQHLKKLFDYVKNR